MYAVCEYLPTLDDVFKDFPQNVADDLELVAENKMRGEGFWFRVNLEP